MTGRPIEIDVDVAGIDEHAGGSIFVADAKTPNDESANVNRSRRRLRGSSRGCWEVERSIRLPFDRHRRVVDFKRFDGDKPAQDRRRQIDTDRLSRKEGTLEPSAVSVTLPALNVRVKRL